MSALAWWLIPIGATVLAVLFVMMRSRPSKPTTAQDAMDNLKRMQEAMERPLPPNERPVEEEPARDPWSRTPPPAPDEGA